MYELVVADGTFPDAELENAQAGGLARVRIADLTTPERVAAETAAAHGVIVTTNPLGDSHIAAFGPNVSVIGRAGIGLDAIDLAAASRAGVAVINQPDYATIEVATHAVAMMLALQRRLLDADRMARTSWGSSHALYDIPPIQDLTLGLVGTGRIGGAVAGLARPLVKEIRAFDPFASPVDGIEMEDTLEALLSGSDIVSLHLPLTPETEHVIDATRLAQMRAGALLINVSRGGLIDSRALAGALANGAIGGAALDVFEQEPLSPADPLARSPRTLLSPHIAWFSTGSSARVRTNTVDDILGFLARGEISHGTLLRPREHRP
jgi:D-3-phosphoglycerate dehydrogenase